MLLGALAGVEMSMRDAGIESRPERRGRGLGVLAQHRGAAPRS